MENKNPPAGGETILVTGGAGFIGSHVCEELLQEGHKVVCLDNFNTFYDPRLKEDNIKELKNNPDFVLIRGDIIDRGALDLIFEQHPISRVIHLAALPGVRTSFGASAGNYIDVNIRGTLNLLEKAREKNIKQFIFASSSSVYGRDSKVPFLETETNMVPVSPYGVSKLSAEVLCKSFHRLYGLPIVALRIFSAFGPRQRPELAIHLFTRLIKRGEPISLLGTGEATRDFTYIDDLVEAMTKILKKDFSFEIFNLGNARTIKVNEVIQMLGERLQIAPNVQRGSDHIGDLDITFADISKAKEMLAWEPQVSFEEGLDKFISWYKEKEEFLGGLEY